MSEVGLTTLSDLISPNYLSQQRVMHARGDYGRSGDKWAAVVLQLAARFKARTVLDYGCGQGRLKRAIGGHIDVAEYDPAIVGKDQLPQCADLVVCTDVLEHIEPDRIDSVIDHLVSLVDAALFVSVSTRPAVKSLPDGRNAHVLLRDRAWWQRKFLSLGLATETVPCGKSEWAAVLFRLVP